MQLNHCLVPLKEKETIINIQPAIAFLKHRKQHHLYFRSCQIDQNNIGTPAIIHFSSEVAYGYWNHGFGTTIL
jgi:hypothetical protein